MADKKEKKIKLKKSQKLTKFYQFLYLSFSNFTKNNLWDSACSCSFGFVFSFVPIVFIIATILINILKISPNAINFIYELSKEFKHIYNLEPIINNILHLKSLRFVDIFLALWVIWIARKLFLSIVRGMNTIFNSIQKRKGLLIQVFTFLSEFAIIFIFMTIILSTFTFRKLFESSLIENSFLSFLTEYFPKLFRSSSNIIFISTTYFLLFIFTLYVYKIVSGTNPPLRKCISYALLCTLTFYGISNLLNLCLNISNYNLVYGTISTVIILMMKVYFFFVIFLLNAQMIYVSQFFDNLLLAELYLLPDQNLTDFNNSMRRKFLANSTVIQTENNTILFKAGEKIYSKGDEVHVVYYLKKGEVWEQQDKGSVNYTQGSFFGEIPLLINQNRLGNATTLCDCEIMTIPAERFLELLKSNQKVSAQAINNVKDYTSNSN